MSLPPNTMPRLWAASVFMGSNWSEMRSVNEVDMNRKMLYSAALAAICEYLDIKPQNIFYAPGTDYFKLGDFSEAKQSRNGELVAVNSKFGTRGYIAPEINAMRGGDGRADLYSLALVIYSLFNRDCLPFVQHGAEALNEEIECADQMRLSGCEIPRIKGLDPEIMDVLLRCLEMDPERRYRSAADAQMAVRRILYSGGKRGRGVRHVLPLLIALTSLGIAGVLVLFGMSAMRGGKSSQTAAQVAAIDGVESTLEAGIDDALPDDISIQLPYQDARGSVPWADWIDLSIDAESGAEVELIIEQNGSAIAKDTFVGADAAVQRQYALAGGSYTVSARYVDAPEINTAVQIAVDGAKKLVELDAPVYAGSQTISGTTAAKSTVAIYDDRDKRLLPERPTIKADLSWRKSLWKRAEATGFRSMLAVCVAEVLSLRLKRWNLPH